MKQFRSNARALNEDAAGGSRIPADAGIGLRGDHYRRMDAEHPPVGWLEVHPENYFGRGGLPHHYLERLRAVYPLSFHGVGLSLGSVDPLDRGHLARIAELAAHYRPDLVSEHLSWGSYGGTHFNDLLPLPLTRESLEHFCARVDEVQAYLGRQILVENPSTYLVSTGDEMNEPEFLNTLARRTGCALLLDINNVYVCARNHGFDPRTWIDAIDARSVGEFHLAGHVENVFEDGMLLIDSHNRPVCDDVWTLYRRAVERIGRRPTLIEWDSELPELEVLVAEAATAQGILETCRAVAA